MVEKRDDQMPGAWERRWHPLRSEWVTITSHRNQRPWSSGDSVGTSSQDRPEFDAGCYLCPGNERVSGNKNPDYQAQYVFQNDHPAFSELAPSQLNVAPGIYQNAPATGTTKVMCYSPNHSESLAELSLEQFVAVFRIWRDESIELMKRRDVEQVLIFENKGEVIGVSNPHPHCQLYAAGFEFKNFEMERSAMRAHLQQTGRHLMHDIIASEFEQNTRVVADSDQAVAFLPYFSRFPFEAFVCPKEQHKWLHELDDKQVVDMAKCLRDLLIRYDNLWNKPFPYMLVLHQAPKHCIDEYYCHIQIHPLMRQANLQKFLAGVESGGGHFLNDVDPDGAAAQLRALPDVHYLQQ